MTGTAIKSYVTRRGRMSETQKNNYAQLSPLWALPYKENLLDFRALYGNDNPVVIEIGFGMGDATAVIAKEHPGINYLGLEVHTPGVAKLLTLIRDNNLSNVRLIEHDAVEVLASMIPKDSIAGFNIFFSDPWPKMRHHKRRLMRRENIALFTDKLKSGGYIYFVTDILDYAMSALLELSSIPEIKNDFKDFAPRMPWRPVTKFEKHAILDGREIKELYWTKK